uniref:Ring finger protein 122 n=1 Tax=Gorilla gorilla gorilla TaxID=9595 RepID=G3RC45_GORGO
MHPFQWCNGCFCGLGLVSTNKSCSMPPISFQDLPLNIYMVIFGTGIFVFMLSLIFCCYFIRCLVKWLEVRCVCPMCNKPIAGPSEATQNIGILLDELV